MEALAEPPFYQRISLDGDAIEEFGDDLFRIIPKIELMSDDKFLLNLPDLLIAWDPGLSTLETSCRSEPGPNTSIRPIESD